MTSTSTVQLFEKASHALKYSKYRPVYPKSVVDTLLAYLSRLGCSQELVIDVGCGSGQSTFHLEAHFKRCTGVDISKAQIKAAQEKAKMRQNCNVSFAVGKATELPAEENTVDLVTIAQAWHWLPDHNKFYAECKRVLKPQGCLAVYGYGNVELANPAANDIVRNFYSKTLEGCWHSERQHIDNEYHEVKLPFNKTESYNTKMFKEMALTDFIGYVSSWSGYEKYCELHPENSELADMEVQIRSQLSVGKECTHEVKVDMHFPMFIILGQNTS